VTRLELTPYRVAFAAPARDASGRLEERQGLVLTLGAGRGELAPLPGRSRETLEASRTALEALDSKKLPRAEELRGEGWLSAIVRASNELPAQLPAARHALETALLDWCGVLRGQSGPALVAAALGTDAPAVELPVAALIDAEDLERATRQAERARAAGIGTAKLKIAGDERDETIVERVRALRPHLRLRVDANRSLPLERCAGLLSRLAELGLEYMEEPVPFAGLTRLPPLPLPLAADESLLEPEFSLETARARGIGVIVLKPMVLGFLRALELGKAARAAGYDVVLSHTFDGPWAMAAARCLALGLGARRYADGLAAHAALDAWPHPLPEHVMTPRLAVWTAPGLGLP
jgi:L-Ala-D/L-Glu epimerase